MSSAQWFVNESVQSRFKKETGPSGRKWAQLKPTTVRERKSKGFGPSHPILERTGRLKNDIWYRIEKKNVVRIGTSVSYAPWVHGQRPGQENSAKNTKARPFLWFNRKDMNKIGDIFTKWSFRTLVRAF